MSTGTPEERPARRARRRAVRPAGTVGDVDESLLRSSFPVPDRHAPDDPGTAVVGVPSTPRRRRAPDDEDTGWGRPVDDSNDDRLTRERPPHW